MKNKKLYIISCLAIELIMKIIYVVGYKVEIYPRDIFNVPNMIPFLTNYPNYGWWIGIGLLTFYPLNSLLCNSVKQSVM